MPILVIRHGLSEANNRDNVGTLAFAAKNAPLMEKGKEQARERAMRLSSDYGINPQTTAVAVSDLLRTRETAKVMGFQQIAPYESLNEVEHGMAGAALRAMLDAGQLPAGALHAAEAILRQPPSQEVWITHGLVIAGLSHVLGIAHRFERLIPRFCEVREFPL